MLKIVICVLLGFTVAHGYRMFADRIPNGISVPHPCKPNVLWHGVGHFNTGGGGFRNPFGQDFDHAGKNWTVELCQKDSDKDGKTNGQELGDPDCVWTQGQIPKYTTGLSHPGICEPIDSAYCQHRSFHTGLFHNQQEWMEDACKSDVFNCSALQEQGVKSVTTRLDFTKVQPKETTYICQIFKLDDLLDQDYHMVAATPIINNSYVLHHMALFGCEDGVDSRSAFECDMLPDRRCKTIISIWTLGLNGDCLHPKAGFRLGKNGLKTVALQLHWNNPSLEDSWSDGSGLQLHYTPHLRQFDSSMFLVGNENFRIPPRSLSTVVTSHCGPSCTGGKLRSSIYITAAFNHMHYLGRKMRMELLRNGTVLKRITNDHIYDYDSPKTYSYSDPIEVRPYDEIRTVCEYSSEYKAVSTYFGESTAEEMCYGFLTFYPAQSLTNTPFCTSYGNLSHCDKSTYDGCDGQYSDAWYQDFASHPAFLNVTAHCQPFGHCTIECFQTIMAAKQSDPCFENGERWDSITFYRIERTSQGRDFLASLRICQPEVDTMMNSKDIIH